MLEEVGLVKFELIWFETFTNSPTQFMFDGF